MADVESRPQHLDGAPVARRLTLAEIAARCVCILHAHAYPDVERVRLACHPGEGWAWRREAALLEAEGFALVGCGHGEANEETVFLYERSVRDEQS